MDSLPNDGSFFAEYQRLQAEKAEAASLLENTSHVPPPEEAPPPLPAEPTLAPTPVASVSGECADSDFLSSPSWSGLKRGYMFKLGDQGLGGCPTSGLDAAQHCHPHWAVRLCAPCRSPSGSLWLEHAFRTPLDLLPSMHCPPSMQAITGIRGWKAGPGPRRSWQGPSRRASRPTSPW